MMIVYVLSQTYRASLNILDTSTSSSRTTPAKQVEEDDSDEQAVHTAVTPATEHKGARRAPLGSVKAKNPAKGTGTEDDFDADAAYAQIASVIVTPQKSGRRSIPFKMQAKDILAETKAEAKQKTRSHRSADKEQDSRQSYGGLWRPGILLRIRA